MFFDWYAFLPLIQPSLLCKESVRGMLEYVLGNGYCYALYRDVNIRLHDYYYDMISIISSKKLFTNYKEWKPFHKKDHILSLEGQANTGSGLMHQYIYILFNYIVFKFILYIYLYIYIYLELLVDLSYLNYKCYTVYY